MPKIAFIGINVLKIFMILTDNELKLTNRQLLERGLNAITFTL